MHVQRSNNLIVFKNRFFLFLKKENGVYNQFSYPGTDIPDEEVKFNCYNTSKNKWRYFADKEK